MTEYKKYPIEGFPNAFILRDPSNHAPTDKYVVRTPAMIELLTELAAKRPMWEFIGTSLSRLSGDGAISSNQFDVYEKGERLGDITTSFSDRRGGPAEPDYRYDTPRLEKDRQRGSWTKTTNLDKAVKGILKAFTPKTLTERVAKAQEAIDMHVRNASARHVNGFNTAWRNSSFAVMDYVVENWQEFTEGMTAIGLTPPTEEVRDIYIKARNSTRLLELYHNDKGVLVLTRGSDYIVVRGSDLTQTTEILSSDELPPIVRRNVGILKLNGEGMVPNVGVRDGDDAFYVYAEEAA